MKARNSYIQMLSILIFYSDGNSLGKFAMSADTGVLTLAASKLDFKIASLHTLTVQVFDGKFTAEAKVEITVIVSGKSSILLNNYILWHANTCIFWVIAFC